MITMSAASIIAFVYCVVGLVVGWLGGSFFGGDHDDPAI